MVHTSAHAHIPTSSSLGAATLWQVYMKKLHFSILNNGNTIHQAPKLQVYWPQRMTDANTSCDLSILSGQLHAGQAI